MTRVEKAIKVFAEQTARGESWELTLHLQYDDEGYFVDIEHAGVVEGERGSDVLQKIVNCLKKHEEE